MREAAAAVALPLTGPFLETVADWLLAEAISPSTRAVYAEDVAHVYLDVPE